MCIYIYIAKKLMLFSETVPRSIWDELPDKLKKEVQVGIEAGHQQQITKRMNYDF